jgi:site-specific recombinase XerD
MPEAQSEKGKWKPLGEAVANYLADCEARSLEPSTIRSYRNTLESFVSFSDANRCFDTSQFRWI